jgi:hypothetical protein
MTNGLSDCLFVFVFEAWELDIPGELHGCGCEMDRVNLARDRSLGQGILCREEPGVKEESFFDNERTQARFSAF